MLDVVVGKDRQRALGGKTALEQCLAIARTRRWASP